MILAYVITYYQYYFLVLDYWGLRWVAVARTFDLE